MVRLSHRCGLCHPILLHNKGVTLAMDTKWFKTQLLNKKMSQRQLAKTMGVDHAAISLMLRGIRRMQPSEAHELATIFGVKTTEVLRRAGIEVHDDVLNVPITSYVDDEGELTLFPEKTYDHVVGPADCPRGTYAVQCRARSHPQDGWVLFVSPDHQNADTAFDKLCVVALNNGTSVCAIVRRGYRTNTFNLLAWPGRDVRTDMNVIWVAPVLWIKP